MIFMVNLYISEIRGVFENINFPDRCAFCNKEPDFERPQNVKTCLHNEGLLQYYFISSCSISFYLGKRKWVLVALNKDNFHKYAKNGKRLSEFPI